MTKKAEKTVSRDYLNSKLNLLKEQLGKVEEVLDGYLEMRQKLIGAIEITNSMLKDLGTEEPEPEKNE